MSIIQPKNDKRQYKPLTLSNQLQTLLISDPDTDTSGCSLVVQVGSFDDPGIEGLAHFCEHMLFLGTKKYPKQDEYQDFISKNNGSYNASTAETKTSYYFSVGNDSFNQAVDRFSQFFLEPLFNEDCNQKEMQAVDSEYNLQLQQDVWRNYQMSLRSSDKNSKRDRFVIGNNDTLNRPDIREKLLEFFNKHYSANNMKLVVLSNQTIQQLTELVEDKFSGIVNNNVPQSNYGPVPFSKESLQNLYKIVPVNDKDQLQLKWVVPYQLPFYDQNPDDYVSQLIGHEGKNSLLSLLIKENLALELSCSLYETMKTFTLVNVSINLTKKGLKEYEQVIKYVYSYILMLKEKGVQKWIYEELRDISQINFDFYKKQKTMEYVNHVAQRLVDYPTQDVLSAENIYKEYKPEVYQTLLNSIKHDNLNVFLISKDFQNTTDQVEQYFKVEYSKFNFQSFLNSLEHFKPILKGQETGITIDLPLPNKFIPKNTDLLQISKEDQVLKKILSTECVDLWHQADTEFGEPKIQIQLRIYLNDNGFGQNISTTCFYDIWIKLLNNYLREFKYQASVASIECDIFSSPNGLHIKVEGFNDSMLVFITELLNEIQQFKVELIKDQYESLWEQVKNQYNNQLRIHVYNQLFQIHHIALKDGSNFQYSDLAKEITNCSYEKMIEFQKTWFIHRRAELLIIGNITTQDALSIGEQTHQMFLQNHLTKHDIVQQRVLKLPKQQKQVIHQKLLNPNETNSGIIVVVQHSLLTLRTETINKLYNIAFKSKFFDQLRTNEQLGYVVFSGELDHRNVNAQYFLVQSNVKDASYLSSRIWNFIDNNLPQIFKEMTDDEFQTLKKSLNMELSEKDTNLYKRGTRLWQEIISHQYQFTRKKDEIELLKEITKEDLLNYYNQYLVKERRVLELHLSCTGHQETYKAIDGNYYENTKQFRRSTILFPDFYLMK